MREREVGSGEVDCESGDKGTELDRSSCDWMGEGISGLLLLFVPTGIIGDGKSTMVFDRCNRRRGGFDAAEVDCDDFDKLGFNSGVDVVFEERE